MGVRCPVFESLLIYLLIFVSYFSQIWCIVNDVPNEMKNETPIVTITPPQDNEYIVYNTSKPLVLTCNGFYLPNNTRIIWYQYAKTNNELSTAMELRADIRQYGSDRVQFKRTFTKKANSTKIYCGARGFNKVGEYTVTRSKNLTLIIQGSNLTNVDEYFRKLGMSERRDKLPTEKSALDIFSEEVISLERELEEDNTNVTIPSTSTSTTRLSTESSTEKFVTGEKKGLSANAIVGIIIGVLLVFLIVIGAFYTRRRRYHPREPDLTNHEPEEHEYATIPDLNYAKLQLPPNSNRELPQIPCDANYSRIIGKLVPKTKTHFRNSVV